MGTLPKRQRVAAYAVILRDDRILLSRLAPSGLARASCGRCPAAASTTARTRATRWCARSTRRPGSTPRSGETARVYSAHLPRRLARRPARRRPRAADRVRRVGAARRAGAARGRGRRLHRRRRVAPGRGRRSTAPCPVVPLVVEALRRPPAVPAAAGRGVRPGRGATTQVLLTRISARGSHPGPWTLPGGGVDHGESPRAAPGPRGARGVRRRRATVGELLDVHDLHFGGTAPVRARRGLPRRAPGLRARRVADGAEPRVVEVGRHHRRRRLGAGRGRRRRPGRVLDLVARTPLGSLADARGREPLGWRHVSETVFTYAAPALKFGAGRLGRGRPRPRGVRRPPGAAGHRPGRRRDRPPGPDRRADARRAASRPSIYDRARVEPTDESMERGDRLRPRRRARSTRSSRSAAARRSTPPRRSTCSLTNPGELMDYVNAPVGKAPAPGAAAAAAGRGPDHHRHRRREHHDLRARRARRSR